MMQSRVNLGCGSTFVDSAEWLNLDYSPASPRVTAANLTGTLPIADRSMSVVYSSHFLEHVPKSGAAAFLEECFRILKPGGTLRLVLPDLEELCREYLRRRESGEHQKAQFVVIEMIDQCVRMQPGGELARLYSQYQAQPERYSEMIEYVRFRNGKDLQQKGTSVRTARPWNERVIRQISRTGASFRRRWFSMVTALLPGAARAQNVSLTAIGERHQWIWDFWQLADALTQAGFVGVARRQADRSGIPDFPCFPLDLDDAGKPRKGAESMYVEASRPEA